MSLTYWYRAGLSGLTGLGLQHLGLNFCHLAFLPVFHLLSHSRETDQQEILCSCPENSQSFPHLRVNYPVFFQRSDGKGEKKCGSLFAITLTEWLTFFCFTPLLTTFLLATIYCSNIFKIKKWNVVLQDIFVCYPPSKFKHLVLRCLK